MQHYSFFLVLGLLTLFSCELDEIADVKPECTINASIMVSPGPNCTGACTLSITSTTNITNQCDVSYFWSFGDGGDPFIGEFPDTHTYSEVGAYQLVLTVTEIGDVENVDVASVTVIVEDPTQPPVAVIEVDDPNCFGPCTLRLTGENSLNENTYLWDFGDGTTPSTEPNPEHVFAPSREPYTVTLTVGNDIDNDITTKQIFADWRLFEQSYPAQDLGSALNVFQQDNESYILLGKQQFGTQNFGIYALKVNPDGSNDGDFCTFEQLSTTDFINDAILLSNGEVAVVGSTENANNNADLLLLTFNPAVPCSSTPIGRGEDDRIESGKAIVEINGGSGIEMAVAGEVRDNGDSFVYFRCFTDGGGPCSDEVLIPVAGESVTVTDILQTANGEFWICGQLDPNGNDEGQAFLLNIDASGSSLGFFTYGDNNSKELLTKMTLNQAGTHIVAVGYSFSDFDPFQMIFLRAPLNNPAGANLQAPGGAVVIQARSVKTLPNGQLLVAGSSNNGAAMEIFNENGTSVDSNTFGSSSFDAFNAAICTSDGGFAGAGVRGGNIVFIKTDNLLIN